MSWTGIGDRPPGLHCINLLTRSKQLVATFAAISENVCIFRISDVLRDRARIRRAKLTLGTLISARKDFRASELVFGRKCVDLLDCVFVNLSSEHTENTDHFTT